MKNIPHPTVSKGHCMDTSPMITTLLPTYRRPGLLKSAMRSVLDQTYTNLTLLVCDNVSEDGTREVVMEFAKKDPRVRYFCQPQHVTMIENFEKAWSLVETPYYSFLCDDDFLMPWYYEEAIQALEKHPSAAMFAAGTLVVDERGKVFRETQLQHDGIWDVRSSKKEDITNVVAPMVLQSCLFRRGEHEKLPRDTHDVGWDGAVMLNVALNYPIVVSSKVVVGYRRHSKQFSSVMTPAHMVWHENKFASLLAKADCGIKEKILFFDENYCRLRCGIILAVCGNSAAAKVIIPALLRKRPFSAFLLKAIIAVCQFLPMQNFLKFLYQIYRSSKTDLHFLKRRKYRVYINKYVQSGEER